MIYAFTGLARKLSFRELAFIRDIVKNLPDVTGLRTGGAIGVDTAVAWYGYQFHSDTERYIIAPTGEYWSEKVPLGSIVRFAPQGSTRSETYMNRNEMLVGPPTDLLVAFPETKQHVQRSGTWATIRRARKRQIPVELYPLRGV